MTAHSVPGCQETSSIATIRRLYIYLVCLISLQAAAAAAVALLGGLLRWLLGANAPDALSLTFQLAVVIVGTPVFLGHWLWALRLAGRDPVEHNAASRRLYLYLTQAIATGYLAWAVFTGVGSAFLLLPGRTQFDPPEAELWGMLFNSLIALIVGGGLWAYHDQLVARAQLAPSPFSRLLHHLYHLGFSGLGLSAFAFGLAWIQISTFHRLGGDPTLPLAPGLALVAAGGPAWLFHEWRRGRTPGLLDATADVLRWLYLTLFRSASCLAIFFGLLITQFWIFHHLAGEPDPVLPNALAVFTVGVPVLIYHEVALRRLTRESLRPYRWFHSWLGSVVGPFIAAVGLVVALQWLFEAVAEMQPRVPDGAALVVPGLFFWVFFQRDMSALSRALGVDEPSGGNFARTARLFCRFTILAYSGAGVRLAAAGLVGLQEWAFTRLGGEEVLRWPNALAWLVVGVPLWLYYWRWAQRRFASPLPDERQSDLRKVYLYAILYVSVNAAIIAAGLLVNGALRALLGLPTGGQFGLALALIIAAGLLWAYHAAVLRGDIARAGASSLQAGLQRLYWHLVAALGLVAFVVGLAGELQVALSWLAVGFAADTGLRTQWADFTATLVAGLPVWLLAWLPAQRVAAQAGPAGESSRRSTLRKLYLYAFALAAIVVALFSTVTVVYQVLNAVLRLNETPNLLAQVARSVGFAVIAAAVWVYHTWVLQGDGARLKADRAASDQQAAQAQADAQAQLAALWAQRPIAIVDDADGAFGQLALEALRRHVPYLTLVPVALTPQAAAALGQAPEADPAALLASAHLIVAPWTALASGGVLATCPAPKIIAPVSAPGVQWVGGLPLAEGSAPLVQAVRQWVESQPAVKA